MTHASVDKETRDKIGISDTLIRLSCGLEDVEDLIADVDQALTAAVRHCDLRQGDRWGWRGEGRGTKQGVGWGGGLSQPP